MYTVAFSDFDKKLGRSIKALKAKNGHSLYQADQLLKSIHEMIDNSIKLTIVVSDMDKELDYRFENKVISANAAKPMLMAILEEDIITSGHEDGQKILNDLMKQYQSEVEKESEEKTQEDSNSRTGKGRKKGLNLLGKFRKGSKELEEENSTVNDFADLEEQDKEVAAASINDFEEMENLSYQFTEIEEEPPNDPFEKHFATQGETETAAREDYSQFSEEDLSSSSYTDTEFSFDSVVENEEDPIIEDTFEEEAAVYESVLPETQSQVETSKNEQVVFPSYDSYLDLSIVQPIVERNKDRFDNQNLIKFLGINTNEQTVNELEKVMLQHAAKSLGESRFELLKDYFHNSIANIKDKIQTELAQTYDQALSLDYRMEAAQKMEEELTKIYGESGVVFSKYEQDQEEEYQLKVEKFEQEQKKALDEFIRSQSLEKMIFIQDLNEKKSSRINLYKESMQKELNSKEEKLLDEKMYELKYASVNQLSESKRQSIRRFEEQMDSAVDDAWMNIQTALEELQIDIQSYIPTWKEEIEEKRRLEAEEREEQRQQQALELERQRIELQKQQLEMQLNGIKTPSEQPQIQIIQPVQQPVQQPIQQPVQQSNKEDYFYKFIENKLSELDKKIETTLQEKQNTPVAPIPFPTAVQTPTEMQQRSRRFLGKKSLFTGSALAVLVGSGAIAGHSLTSDSLKPKVVEAKDISSETSELSNKVNSVEQNVTIVDTKKKKTNATSLDKLLDEKKYAEAMLDFNDPDNLEKIEETLYLNKELETLITFNKTFNKETAFGSLDEAILSKETDKLITIYKKMPESDKKNLTKERKASMALLFFQKDEKKLANQVLGIKK